jgi:hypothetical protein
MRRADQPVRRIYSRQTMPARKRSSPDHADAASPVRQRFTDALNRLVSQIKQDREVIAAILCGSLSHDTVWAKSDIDLVLITADDRQGNRSSATLDADGIPVHALMFPRTAFRKEAEGTLHHSFVHSFVAKGTLLFTHDPTIADLLARVRVIGERDTRVQLVRCTAGALGCIDKARKWLVTRGDLDYSALWILYAASQIARIEIVQRTLLADREVIPQAASLNPALFRIIYRDLLNTKKTRANVTQALETLERYIRDRATVLLALVIEHLEDIGEARSCSELADHFTRHYGIEDVTIACEYLATEGLIGKASLPLRLTRKSTVALQELAFFAIEH